MFWYLITVALAIGFYLLLVKPFNFWKNHGVAQHHFLTTTLEMFLSFIPYRSFPGTIKKMYEDFPDFRYSGCYQFYKPSLVIRDPELIKQVTVKDFDHFVDHMMVLQDSSDPVWEKNLFALKGDKWKDMRSTISPSFTSSKMKIMFNLITDYAKQFIKYFEENLTEGESIEMKNVFTRFTNDVIATAAFGCNCDSIRNPNNDFYVMGKKMTNMFGFWFNLKMLFVFLLPKVAKKFRINLFPKDSINFFKTIIQKNIEIRERDGIVRPDMIHLMLEAKKGRLHFDQALDDSLETDFTVIEGSSLEKKEEKRKKEQLTDVDITAQAFIFFFAGFEAVSSLMCFLAYELAVNVEIQERLQAEIDDAFKHCNGTITYEAVSKMRYLNMVVAETFRKWPVSVVTDRVCSKPYTIEPILEGEVPVTLNAGQIVTIPIFGLHRDPKIYSDPERFDPERFNEENKSKLSSYAYLPFGVGPRSCIGNRFALMEIKLVFLFILKTFNITVTSKTQIPLVIARKQFQLTSKGGFWLGLKPRAPK